MEGDSYIPDGTGLTAPPRNSCMKLSTIQVPAGKDGDMERFAAGSAVGTQRKHGKGAWCSSCLLTCQVVSRCFRDQFPISAVLNQVTSLNHSHIRCSLESVLRILFVPYTRKKISFVHLINIWRFAAVAIWPLLHQGIFWKCKMWEQLWATILSRFLKTKTITFSSLGNSHLNAVLKVSFYGPGTKITDSLPLS